MAGKTQEVREELKLVLSGKTKDALWPPLVYAILQSRLGILPAALAAMAGSLATAVYRRMKGEKTLYAFTGFLGIALASGLAYYNQNASNFYLPGIVSGGVITAISLFSLLFGKPLAAWTSHLTRGWPTSWYWRKDVKPAYTNVTVSWTLLFAVRLSLQLYFYLQNDVANLTVVNTILGLPATIGVLVLSYLYGIWKLKALGGPSVKEHEENLPKPWTGQTRGF